MKQQALRTVGIVGVFIGLTVGIVQDTRRLHPSVPSLEAPSEPALVSPAQATSLLAQLPLTFVENQGQWETGAKFLAKKGNLAAWFEPDAITLQLAKQASEETVESVAVRLAFEGASPDALLKGERQQMGTYNYFLGNDPTKWHTRVPGYAAVRYHALYDGIDVRVREHNGRLEYDLLLEPEADLRQVVIRTEGIERLELAEDGSLRLHTALGPIEQHPPTTWYELASGERQPVEAKFILLDEHRYGFEVPQRNTQLALIIDPGLVYSTLLGGSGISIGQQEEIKAVHAYPSGVVVVAGSTHSFTFPTTPGAYQPTFRGGLLDAFVAVLAPAGNGPRDLLASTLLGGSFSPSPLLGQDGAEDLVVTQESYAGEVIVVGSTTSPDFPTTPGAYQTRHAGEADVFITELNADLDQLLASTLVGGSWPDHGFGIALAPDNSRDILITGSTCYASGCPQGPGASLLFPFTPGAFQTRHAGGYDGFVSRFNRTLSTLVASTFLGGSLSEWAMGIATTPYDGALVVVGQTDSFNFPVTPNFPPPGGRAFQTATGGLRDGFVAIASADLSQLLYSTYFGGSQMDRLSDVVRDPSGTVTAVGSSSSANLPMTPGAYQTTLGGGTDICVLQLRPDGNGRNDLRYSTYLGGEGAEDGEALTQDPSSGIVTIAGKTSSTVFPTTPGAFQTTLRGLLDAVVSRFSLGSAGRADLLYSTFLGGSDGGYVIEAAYDLVQQPSGVTTVVGKTTAGDFPTTPGAYQTSQRGEDDAFAAWLTLMAQGYDSYGAPTSATGLLTLRGEGPMPQAGTTLLLSVTNAAPNTVGYVVVATAPNSPGPLLINPSTALVVLPIYPNATGHFRLSLPTPAGIPQGTILYVQTFVIRPDGRGLDYSNGLRITF